jgi:hypothetical protein
MGGQNEAANGEEDEIAPRRNAERSAPEGHDRGQGQAREDNAAENDQNGGEGQPFPEQPGEAEEEYGQMDLGEASRARRHGVIIFLFLAI